jgi:hypothetical protein
VIIGGDPAEPRDDSDRYESQDWLENSMQTDEEKLRHLLESMRLVIDHAERRSVLSTDTYAEARAGLEIVAGALKDAARWRCWRKWFSESTNEGHRLPDEVLLNLDGFEIDDAMDAAIDAARKAGEEGVPSETCSGASDGVKR